MKGKVRVPRRNLACPKCGDFFEDIGKKGYVCPICLTVPDRYYLDIHFRGKRVRVFCDKQGIPLDSYERAFDLLAHINYEIENHLFDVSKYLSTDIKKYLFENLIKAWLELKIKEGMATVYKYQQYNRDYFVYFKNKDVREIRTSLIHDFYYQLPEHLSKKSKKNILGSLHAFFSWLLRMEYIERLAVFPKIELDQPDWQWVDVDIQSEILLAIPAEDRYLYLFLALHGCRPAEGRALKIKDIDFIRGAITIRRTFSGRSANVLVEHTKTKKQRVIPINGEMINVLKQLCQNRFGEDFVFLNPRTNKPYAKSTYQEIWAEARKAVGLTIKSYEGLRHSFASQRVCRGVDIYLISKVLGHSNLRTTERYSHVNLVALKNVMDVLSVSKASSNESLCEK